MTYLDLVCVGIVVWRRVPVAGADVGRLREALVALALATRRLRARTVLCCPQSYSDFGVLRLLQDRLGRRVGQRADQPHLLIKSNINT